MRQPRIAICSPESTSGKSTFIGLLAGVYSRSHGRRVAIVSTGDIKDNKEMISIDYHNEVLANPHTIKAVLENGLDNPDDILNYGAKQGREDVFIFDLVSDKIDESEQDDYFKRCVSQIPSDLMLVEIKGDIHSDLNKAALESCDAAIVLFKQSKPSIRKCREFQEEVRSIKPGIATMLCCNEFDPIVITEKNLDKKVMTKSSCLKVPFNMTIRKACMDGSLDRLCYDIIAGEGNVLPIRIRMYEILHWMLDDNSVKIVKEVDKWFR